jgi:uncharacterized protein (DUF302 family)
VCVERFSVVSARPFEEVLGRLTATIGRPDGIAVQHAIADAGSLADVEAIVHGAIGPSGLMEFIRFDVGDVLRKEWGGDGRKITRLVVGNPLIMKEIVKSVPDTGSYVPLTILVAERADGVHLSYDKLASLLAPYGCQEALAVARHSDAMIVNLLESAAGAGE